MLITYSFTTIAINIRRWFEVGMEDGVMEHGSRVELRLLEPQPHRGTESAAQKLVVDTPFWRADIFKRLDTPDRPYSAAHFHPRFTGVEPCERNWSSELTNNAWEWLADQLSRIEDRLEAAGLDRALAVDDAAEIRQFIPQVVQTAQLFSPELTLSRDEDFALTKDTANHVRLMITDANRSLVDGDYIKPWMEFSK